MTHETQHTDVVHDSDGSRSWRNAAIGASVLAVIAVLALAAVLVFAGANSLDKDVMACVPGKTQGGCPPKGASYVEGLVLKAENGSFSILVNGSNKQLLTVRKADRPYIDVQHAKTHAALGQPVRVYTKDVDGTPVVIFMEDAPLGSGMM